MILITELSHPLQECRVNRIDASLSLESLHDHRAGMLVHLLLHAVQIIVTGKFHAPYQRFKRRPVGLVSCHSHCAHRAPVEGVFHGDKLIAAKALCEGVLSGRLQGTLNGLCSTVCKEDTVHLSRPGQLLGRLRRRLAVVQVGGVEQGVHLVFQRLRVLFMSVSKAAHSYACGKIQVFFPFCVIQVYTLASLQNDGISVVGVQKRLFRLIDPFICHRKICSLHHLRWRFRYLCW